MDLMRIICYIMLYTYTTTQSERNMCTRKGMRCKEGDESPDQKSIIITPEKRIPYKGLQRTADAVAE